MSQQSRVDLLTKIAIDLASGTNITAAELRGVLVNVVDSCHNFLTEGVAALASSLGNAATKNVGTTAGTVAAGDHDHAGVYQPAGSYAAAVHTHAQSDITNLVTDLAGKLSTTGTAADVNPSGTAIAAALAGKLSTSGTAADVNPSGTAIAAALAGKAASSHTHAQSDITNLVTDLGNKQAASAALSSAQAQGTASIRAIGTTTPADIGTAAAGSSTEAAAKDHVHAIPNGHVSNAKLADMAASTIKARKTASTGAPEDCTVLEVQTLLNPLSINTQTASYTLVLSDTAKLVRMNVSSACVLYVPKESSDTSPVDFPIGTTILIEQSHASGQITVSAVTSGSGSAATINCEGGANKSKAQFALMTLVKTASNTWTLEGNRTT